MEDGFGFHVLSHTDLSRTSGLTGDHDLANFNWNNYSLIVIDGSHNFRNNAVGNSSPGSLSWNPNPEFFMKPIFSFTSGKQSFTNSEQ